MPKFTSLEEIFIDLYVRFIIGLSDDERMSLERLGFQLELAFWFYEDFFRESNVSSLPKFNLHTFCKAFLSQFNHLNPKGDSLDEFIKYKNSIPVCGAIIMNAGATKILLLKPWYSRKFWGFPRGKLAKSESFESCAIRETYEEIGFDISPFLDKNMVIKMKDRGHFVHLFVIKNISEDTKFAPQSRKEVSDICWHSIEDILQSDNIEYNHVMPIIQNLFSVELTLKNITYRGKKSDKKLDEASVSNNDKNVINNIDSLGSIHESIKKLMTKYQNPFNVDEF